jgi:hypothetical protein
MAERERPLCFIFCAEPQGCESMGSMGVDIIYYCNTTCTRILITLSKTEELVTSLHIKHLPFFDNDNESTHRTITHVPSEKSTSPTHTQSCFETFVFVNLRKIDLRSLLQPSSLCHTPHSHQVYTSASHFPSKSNSPRFYSATPSDYGTTQRNLDASVLCTRASDSTRKDGWTWNVLYLEGEMLDCLTTSRWSFEHI